MAEISLEALTRKIQGMEKVRKQLKEGKREFFEEVGDATLQNIYGAIDTSGLNDSEGKVKGWQELHIGKYGGYAAVRPRIGKVTRKKKGAVVESKYAIGHVTSALEYGHIIKTPKMEEWEKGGKSRAYGFYADAEEKSRAMVITKGKEWVRKKLKELG